MKFFLTPLSKVFWMMFCLLLWVSCSDSNLEKVAPTAPTQFSSTQHVRAASPIEAAIFSGSPNNNFPSSKFHAASAVSTAIYTVTDLGTFGGQFSAALDINASGQIVGAAALANGALRPFLYENGLLINLGTLGGYEAIASAINNIGEIVGQSDNSQAMRRGYFYLNGVMTEIPTLGGTESRASGINASGQVVGQARIPNNSNHAYIYENGQISDIGTLGGTTSWANAINTSGQIVGGSHTLPNQSWHAYLYENGVMNDLGTLGGGQSVAFNLNDNGQVAGWSDVTSVGPMHAVIWSNGMITDLGTLGGESIAYEINNAGQVVGYAFTTNNRQHAFLINGGMMQDLNDLIDPEWGWELSIAAGISPGGRKIVGRGIINGEDHAFLLTLSPKLMIGNLIDLVHSFDLPKGIENSLVKKLEHAQDAIDDGDINRACNQITAFINEVEAQAGKKLTQAQADQLIAGANEIKTALGCQ